MSRQLWKMHFLMFAAISTYYGAAANAQAPVCAPPLSGLVGWWPGEGHAEDIIGHNDGMPLGGATYAPGMVGQAFSLNGSTALVKVPDNPRLNFGVGEMTVEAWVQAPPFDGPYGSSKVILGKDNPVYPAQGYFLRITYTNKVEFQATDCETPSCGFGDPGSSFPKQSVRSKSVVADSRWHHVVGLRRANGAREIWVDGVLENTRVEPMWQTDNSNALYIGHLDGVEVTVPPVNFAGSIDEVSVYNRALTAAEIQGIYNAGGTGKCTSQSPAQNWLEITPAGATPPVEWSGGGYDPKNNRLITYFQGNPAVDPRTSNQVWVLTNANGLGGVPVWAQLNPQGTPPISNAQASAVYDASLNRLIIYGGCFATCSPALSDVYVLSNANGLGGTPEWSHISVTNSEARADHSAVYDPQSGGMIAFGGNLAFYGNDQNDTRILSNANGALSPSTWNLISPVGNLPGIRDAHSAVYDEANNRMTIFAGAELIRTCCPYSESDYNDTWVLSNANGLGGTPRWTPLSPSGNLPSPRSYPSTVYDSTNNRMFVFGGLIWDQIAQTNAPIGDLWELTNANGLGGTPVWTQLSPSGAPPGPLLVYSKIAVFDTASQRLILIGQVSSGDSAHVWVLPFSSQAVPCTYSLSATSQSFPDTGGSGTITVTTQSNCAWSVTLSPTWAALTSPSFGAGSGTVTFQVGANAGSAQSGTFSVAGQTFAVTQAGSGLVSGCTYAITPTDQSFPATGGTGTIAVTTQAGCAWSETNSLSWVTLTVPASSSGTGSATFKVAANTGADRTGTFMIAGATFTVEQVAAGTSQFTSTALFPHFASGGSWNTRLVLINTGQSPITARLNFFADAGTPIDLPLNLPQTSGTAPLLASTLERAIAAGATLVVDTASADPLSQNGWVQVLSTGTVTGYDNFRLSTDNGFREVFLPLQSASANTLLLPFDHTAGYGTGVAVANSSTASSSIGVTIRDDLGNLILTTTVQVPIQGHASFDLAGNYPAAAGIRGTIELDGPGSGGIGALGVRYGANHEIAAVAPIVK